MSVGVAVGIAMRFPEWSGSFTEQAELEPNDNYSKDPIKGRLNYCGRSEFPPLIVKNGNAGCGVSELCH